jgi:hypothetical protein
VLDWADSMDHGSNMTKRSGKKAPEMHETQTVYMLAKAAYDTAIAAHNAECKAAGWWEREDDEALDLIEASSERHETTRLFEALRRAERIMVGWCLDHAKAFAPQHTETLATLAAKAQHRPMYWSKLVDLASRLAA